MEHRQHDQTTVTREDRVGQADLDDVPAHRAVAQHRALRDAGGPARVHLPQRIGHADLDRRRPRGTVRQPPIQRTPTRTVVLALGDEVPDGLKLAADLIGAGGH